MKFLAKIATLLIGLLILAGCGESTYIETFDNGSDWSLDAQDGVSGGVVDERLQLTIDLPNSLYYTTMGQRNLQDGAFELDVEAVAGSAESAYGLIFRATPNATDFYYFLISVDGYYSIGGCQNGCQDGDLIRIADDMWIQSVAIEPGLNIAHKLRVETNGTELAYFVDGEEVGRFQNTVLPKGDIGVLLQTFDSAATITYDNLQFTPLETGDSAEPDTSTSDT